MTADVLTGELERLLRRLLSRKGVRHAVLAVASEDGSFQWTGAAGEAGPDGRPMRPETPFFLASVDKLLTATVILKLRERGHIDLSDPITMFLPRAWIDGLHRLGGVDHTGAVCIRHLLGHTSGLADWLEDFPRGGGKSLFERLIKEGDRSLSFEELFRFVGDRLTPHFPPQPAEAESPKVRYCDTNFILLVAIIEAVTGRALHQVYEEFLFRPLGLHHTWFAGHSRPLRETPEPATLWADDEPLELPLLLRSIRGIYSTAEDSLKFLRALTGGRVFDDPATFAFMTGRFHRFGFPLDRAAMRSPSWPIEYGLGIMRFHDPVLELLGRLPRFLVPIYPAPAVLGHTGSTGCWLFHCPRLKLLVSGTVDQATAGAAPYRLVPQVLRLFDDRERNKSSVSAV